MQFYKDSKADEAITESLRMKFLRINHCKHVTIYNANDAKRAIKMRRDREPIFYQKK